MNPLLLLLATLPGLLLSYAIFKADKYEREPLVPMLVCFGLGAAMTFPALEIEKWAFLQLRPYEKGVGAILLTAFAAVALYMCLFYCNTLIKEHLNNSPFRV